MGQGVLHKTIGWVARGTAIVGGVVLSLLVILTTLSIAGRSLSKGAHGEWFFGLSEWIISTGVDEIKGTYELTEAGVAFAIFAFLPVCQFYGAHATVDVFTSGLGPRVTRVLRAFWELCLTGTILFLTERLWSGMMRYIGNGETTLFLQFPVWWAYAASVAAACLASLVALYCAYARVSEVATGRQVLPEGEGA